MVKRLLLTRYFMAYYLAGAVLGLLSASEVNSIHLGAFFVNLGIWLGLILGESLENDSE